MALSLGSFPAGVTRRHGAVGVCNSLRPSCESRLDRPASLVRGAEPVRAWAREVVKGLGGPRGQEGGPAVAATLASSSGDDGCGLLRRCRRWAWTRVRWPPCIRARRAMCRSTTRTWCGLDAVDLAAALFATDLFAVRGDLGKGGPPKRLGGGRGGAGQGGRAEDQSQGGQF